MHLGTLHTGADRVCKVSELADVCCHRNIHTLSEEVQTRVRRGEIPCESSARHCGVLQLRRLREEKLTNVEESKSEGLDGSGDCKCLEVTTMVYGSNTRVDERVVGGFGRTD